MLQGARRPVYPFYGGGGGADLAAAGVVFGTGLSPWQGRMVLAANVLANGENPTTPLRRWLENSRIHESEWL